ncbi:tumor necrosis factor receptor superfamily member 1B isoform X2 [Garra rufa]|uniref:tumor necrosis factor receptor superfamily member 1B isoform X2 n=1 Tax=Garra rufa TaxID=137080 RepID=UPI003CCE9000
MLILVSRLLFMAAVWRVAKGKTLLPYSSSGLCNNTASEYYVKDLRLCCSRCKAGTHLAVKCTSNSDTICEPCQDGHYSDKVNHFENCFSCAKCRDVKGLMYGTECSADTKAVCICKPGMFCFKTNFNQGCEECKKYRSCKPGEYVSREGTPTSDFKCKPCPSGTFSSHNNSKLCKPHTQCGSGSVLKLGDSTTDTQCEMTPATAATTTKAPLQSSPKHFPSNEPRNILSQTQRTITTTTVITTSLPPSSNATPRTTAEVRASGTSHPIDMFYYIGIGVIVLVLLILAVTVTCLLRKRRGLQKVPITDVVKVEQDPSVSSTPDHQRLLPNEKDQKEPSMTSSDSQSQPDSSHSSTDWLERTSQEEYIPEQPSISVHLQPQISITATFNCQLSPTTCSIPLSTSATRTPHVETPVPLSQEEVCISCQQEDGKEALRSVQESGLCAF